MTDNVNVGEAHHVAVDVLCGPYVTKYSTHWTRTHKTANDSFSSLDRQGQKGQEDDDYKDSLNELPFSSPRT